VNALSAGTYLNPIPYLVAQHVAYSNNWVYLLQLEENFLEAVLCSLVETARGI
jgi:hypothetical protein